jgi:hypothetical protein
VIAERARNHRLLHASLCFLSVDVGAEAVLGIVRKQGGDTRVVTSRGNSHEWRAHPHEMRQPSRPNGDADASSLPVLHRERA